MSTNANTQAVIITKTNGNFQGRLCSKIETG